MVSTRFEGLMPSGPIRRGVWLLPIAGIVPAIIFTIGMASPSPDVATNAKGAAENAASVGSLVGGYLYLLALVGLILALMSLYAWLASGPSGGPALAGLVLSVVSLGLELAALGAGFLAAAVAGDVYLSGQTGASAVLTKLSGGSFGRAILVAFIAAIVIGLIGAVAFGVAIWRSGTLPKWAGVLVALGFVLLVGSAPIVTQLGGILLAIGGVWIARTIGRGGEAAAARPLAAATI